ncbi:MAG: DNA polymerase Y family protein [Terracidiphilus sp.]
MSQQLYACVHAAEFPSQALLRLRPDLQALPVAVLEGRAPLEQVCSMNRNARLQGVATGMTRLEAEALASQNGELCLLPRSLESEAAARTVLLECAANFSPRIENASRDASQETACAFVLDIAGTERLFGPPRALAERLRNALKAAGFRVSIAVSANFHAARILAAASRGITAIQAGEEAQALANLPVALLEIPQDHAETLAIWGIRTLGELAALPEVDLIARLGQSASTWRDLALGAQAHAFRPMEAAFSLCEFCEFETPVEQMDSLLFVGARMVDSLSLRAATRAMSLALVTVDLELEGKRAHRLTIRPALPSIDRKFLLKLLQLEIAAHPPPAAVLALTLTAEAGQSSKVQLGLFAPQTPEPSRLDVTIARLKAIAGEDRVGSPVLEDSHRAGSFRMTSFTAENPPVEEHKGQPRMALRRLRPPLAVRVALNAGQPVLFHDDRQSYKIATSFGPWRSSGCWWLMDGWDSDEWDVLAESQGAPVACVLVMDRSKHEWRLEAFYD